MAITYEWSVTSMKKNADEGIVQTYWQKVGTDENGNMGTFNGATPFTPDPSAEGYIAFESLTEADVLGWIQAKVTGSYETHVNEQIQREIDQQTKLTSSLPWE